MYISCSLQHVCVVGVVFYLQSTQQKVQEIAYNTGTVYPRLLFIRTHKLVHVNFYEFHYNLQDGGHLVM